MQKIKSLFMIDDDPEDVEMFFEAVNETAPGIHCNSAYSYKEALQKLENSNTGPDVIFLDLNMPGFDGRMALAEFKKHPLLSPIPVIIYTTSGALKDMEDTMRAGASHFITKPTNYGQLCQTLSWALTQEFIEKLADARVTA